MGELNPTDGSGKVAGYVSNPDGGIANTDISNDAIANRDIVFEDVLRRGKVHYQVIRRKRKVINALKTVMALCVVAAVALALWLPANQYVNSREQERQAVAAMNRVKKWPQGRVAQELNKARQYNAGIAAGNQSFGEYTDPFASDSAGKKDKNKAVTRSERDTVYQGLLNSGSGVMGMVRIPKISVKLPIYHGTSDAVLDKGAGHLYGTSLPVGGKSTNAVITGHTGRPYELLFTRLDELKKGDVIYINTLNHTFGYQITSIHVVLPDDTRYYKVVPGKDLLTLMTCTPYGVNSHRLVITAERRPIPQDIPYPDDASGDGVLAGGCAALAILVLGVIINVIRHRRKWPVRHGR
ncbi:class C sortase [Bifidobacterium sp. ESL0690]|uniref:class C sortase n=1 Tax=Bifidobacterium sp. ESL0690 TaxID=2983214 RepID=UPI0023F8E3F9|nr:class C sortase [Bifidobacterium sp. ESL0690]WEV46176.1 class C sortase [Bifidobacterium sp. ESL0690]